MHVCASECLCPFGGQGCRVLAGSQKSLWLPKWPKSIEERFPLGKKKNFPFFSLVVKWEYIKERVQWWSHSKVLEDSGPTPRAFDSKFKVCSFFNFSKLHPHPIIPLHGNHHFFQNAFFFFTSPSNCIRRCPELSYRGRVWFMNCVCKLSHSWEETDRAWA